MGGQISEVGSVAAGGLALSGCRIVEITAKTVADAVPQGSISKCQRTDRTLSHPGLRVVIRKVNWRRYGSSSNSVAYPIGKVPEQPARTDRFAQQIVAPVSSGTFGNALPSNIVSVFGSNAGRHAVSGCVLVVVGRTVQHAFVC